MYMCVDCWSCQLSEWAGNVRAAITGHSWWWVALSHWPNGCSWSVLTL